MSACLRETQVHTYIELEQRAVIGEKAADILKNYFLQPVLFHCKQDSPIRVFQIFL